MQRAKCKDTEGERHHQKTDYVNTLVASVACKRSTDEEVLHIIEIGDKPKCIRLL